MSCKSEIRKYFHCSNANLTIVQAVCWYFLKNICIFSLPLQFFLLVSFLPASFLQYTCEVVLYPRAWVCSLLNLNLEPEMVGRGLSSKHLMAMPWPVGLIEGQPERTTWSSLHLQWYTLELDALLAKGAGRDGDIGVLTSWHHWLVVGIWTQKFHTTQRSSSTHGTGPGTKVLEGGWTNHRLWLVCDYAINSISACLADGHSCLGWD